MVKSPELFSDAHQDSSPSFNDCLKPALDDDLGVREEIKDLLAMAFCVAKK
jgi:hypothetical protein